MPNLFTIIVTAILAADIFWWWYADRRARRLPNARWWRVLIGLFMGGQVALVLWILGGRALTESAASRPPSALTAAAYLWHLLILPAAIGLTVTTGILLFMWHTGSRLTRRTAESGPVSGQSSFDGVAGAESAKPRRMATRPAYEAGASRTQPRPPVVPDPSTSADCAGTTATRRQFLGTLTAVAPVLLTVAGAAYSVTHLQRFRIRSIGLSLPDLPPELDGLRIALVADLHVGTFTSSRTVKRIVEETSRLQADLVLLPGDLINNSLIDLSDALDAVCNMQSRYGSYLCIGNHDLIDDGAEFVRRAKARVPMLVDESRSVTIRGRAVQLLGLDWNRDEDRIARSVRQLARQIEPGAFPILLAHHPHAFDAAAAAGIPLTVSGHTHGGQLMVNDEVGFGPLLYRYWSGLYRKPGGESASLRGLVVSNGAGHWFPLRTAAPAEIIDLTLRGTP